MTAPRATVPSAATGVMTRGVIGWPGVVDASPLTLPYEASKNVAVVVPPPSRPSSRSWPLRVEVGERRGVWVAGTWARRSPAVAPGGVLTGGGAGGRGMRPLVKLTAVIGKPYSVS